MSKRDQSWDVLFSKVKHLLDLHGLLSVLVRVSTNSIKKKNVNLNNIVVIIPTLITLVLIVFQTYLHYMGEAQKAALPPIYTEALVATFHVLTSIT